jgi:5-methylcytosine-specific restriction endonuclease McrA
MDAAEKREYMKAWRAAHPEKLAEYEANRPPRDYAPYRALKQEEMLAYAKAYYWAHREERLRYCAGRRDVTKAIRAAYRKTDMGRAHRAANACKRRSLKLAGQIPTGEEVARILSARCCYLCRAQFSKSNPATLDHVIPLAKGGTHAIANLAAAHLLCNLRKNARLENPITGQALLL